MQRFGASQRQTCALLQLSRTVYHHDSVARDHSALEMRIKEIMEVRWHYGAPRVYVMLRREGWRDNHQRVERVYRELGLSLCRKRARRSKSYRRRQPTQSVSAIKESWSKNLVADALFDGRRLRTLTIVVNYPRECLAIEVGGSLGGEHAVAALTRLAQHRPRPRYIKADNGSEFISKVLDKWAYENGVEIDFSRPGKPTEYAKNESFNGRFREECLNAHWFSSLVEARRKIEVCREYYNEARPHSALQWMTPAEFARQCTDRAGAAHPEVPEFSS